MRIKRTLKNIQARLDINETMLEGMMCERASYVKIMENRKPKELKGMTYSDMPKGGRADYNLDVIVALIDELNIRIAETEDRILGVRKQKRDFETMGGQLKDHEAEVFKLGFLDGIPLKEVADMLELSYGTVKNISCKINKILKG